MYWADSHVLRRISNRYKYKWCQFANKIKSHGNFSAMKTLRIWKVAISIRKFASNKISSTHSKIFFDREFHGTFVASGFKERNSVGSMRMSRRQKWRCVTNVWWQMWASFICVSLRFRWTSNKLCLIIKRHWHRNGENFVCVIPSTTPASPMFVCAYVTNHSNYFIPQRTHEFWWRK